MRRSVAAAIVVILLLLPLGGPASAQGLSPGHLSQVGWTCFPVPDLGVHCAPPGQAFPPTGPSLQLLYFTGEDPTSTTAAFLGTESLIRDDVFQRRKARSCPTDPSGGWFPIPLPTGTYWGCHHR